MPSPITSALDALATKLDGLGLRWYVFGAQAVLVHGRPRLTEDIDITVDLGTLSIQELLVSLGEVGFALTVAPDEEFLAVARVAPLIHQPSGIGVDLIIAGPGLEQRFLEGSERCDLGGTEVPVIRAEHLLVTKILAGRPKDLLDVEGFLRRSGATLELDVTRAILAELEQALGQSDLMPLLDEQLERARRAAGA
ncbi:MAG: nucleotidyl transferase AbiEii/AbiGii toxin family protein [Deltaproteobacteria bacterium]|nr:nucleotidyl transferase AbiEii/AbiGii toxin family protein [Deltaproteobacteria bacterium]